ncbi:MAG: esterase family protein [Verrucomicrobiales bacterium]|nr:esterase family protein [Verrucomicrobiales bacterium]
MKKSFAVTVFIFIATVALGKPPWDGPPSTWSWVVDDEIKIVKHHVLKSPSMGFDIGFNVLLPPSYHQDKDKRFPVVYYLHGAGGSEKSANVFGWEVLKAMREEAICETIYIFPNGGTFSRYRDWKTKNVKAETFIIDELIPHIDKTYRTINDRKGRALSGFSMGGGGSIYFLFKYPEKFGAAATMSAAIDWTNNESNGEKSFDLAKKNADKLRGNFRLLMVVGENDQLFTVNQKFHEQLKSLNLDSRLVTHPGIKHNLGKLKEKSGRDIVLALDKWFRQDEKKN